MYKILNGLLLCLKLIEIVEKKQIIYTENRIFESKHYSSKKASTVPLAT